MHVMLSNLHSTLFTPGEFLEHFKTAFKQLSGVSLLSCLCREREGESSILLLFFPPYADRTAMWWFPATCYSLYFSQSQVRARTTLLQLGFSQSFLWALWVESVYTHGEANVPVANMPTIERFHPFTVILCCYCSVPHLGAYLHFLMDFAHTLPEDEYTLVTYEVRVATSSRSYDANGVLSAGFL